jgi:microsomal prostaglandin-E synthase 2
VFGVLRAVKTFETFADVMANTSIRPWYERMEKAVGPATRTDGLEN